MKFAHNASHACAADVKQQARRPAALAGQQSGVLPGSGSKAGLHAAAVHPSPQQLRREGRERAQAEAKLAQDMQQAKDVSLEPEAGPAEPKAQSLIRQTDVAMADPKEVLSRASALQQLSAQAQAVQVRSLGWWAVPCSFAGCSVHSVAMLSILFHHRKGPAGMLLRVYCLSAIKHHMCSAVLPILTVPGQRQRSSSCTACPEPWDACCRSRSTSRMPSPAPVASSARHVLQRGVLQRGMLLLLPSRWLHHRWRPPPVRPPSLQRRRQQAQPRLGSIPPGTAKPAPQPSQAPPTSHMPPPRRCSCVTPPRQPSSRLPPCR